MRRIILLSLMLSVFCCKITAVGVTIHNGTDESICFAFVKTNKTKLGFGKDRYQIMYDEDIQIQSEVLPAGTSVTLKSYKQDLINYDRTLWVVPASKCGSLMGDFTKGSAKPKDASYVEVGSKDNVVVVSAGVGKYKVKPWNKELGEDLEMRRRAMFEALRASGLTWEQVKDASLEQWEKIKKSFKDFYSKLKKGTFKSSQQQSKYQKQGGQQQRQQEAPKEEAYSAPWQEEWPEQLEQGDDSWREKFSSLDYFSGNFTEKERIKLMPQIPSVEKLALRAFSALQDEANRMNPNDTFKINIPSKNEPAAVRSAWKRLSLKLHPDKYKDAKLKVEAEKNIKLLNSANETLLNMDKIKSMKR